MVDGLGRRLPPGWSVRLRTNGADHATVDLSSPEASAELRARVVANLTPRVAKQLGAGAHPAPDLILARFLTPLTRERLREAGVGYVDLTGNAYLAVSLPALFIETTGAQTESDPTAEGRVAQGAQGRHGRAGAL